MYSNEELPNCQLNGQSSNTKLLDLNTDCLLKIFRNMFLGDIAVASDICQRFRQIGIEAFKYEWKEKTIFLSNESSEMKLLTTAILRNFGKQIQKINLHFDERKNDKFLEMIIEKCSLNLIEADFSGKIPSKETVTRFKNKFINLRSVGFETNTNSVELECIQQHFPALEQCTFFGDPFENQNVEKFIRLNPQLKSLSLLYRNYLDNARNLLEIVDQHLVQLEQLELEWMPGFANGIGYQPKFLRNLKRLKFRNFGCGPEMQYLSISNEKVEELELEEGRCDDPVVEFICQYKEVKKLAIRDLDYPLEYNILLKLNEHLPKLAEFEISTRCRNVNHKDIVHFVLGSEQLVKLSIKDAKLEDILGQMRALQQKLDSSKWTIDCCESNNELIISRSSNFS